MSHASGAACENTCTATHFKTHNIVQTPCGLKVIYTPYFERLMRLITTVNVVKLYPKTYIIYIIYIYFIYIYIICIYVYG